MSIEPLIPLSRFIRPGTGVKLSRAVMTLSTSRLNSSATAAAPAAMRSWCLATTGMINSREVCSPCVKVQVYPWLWLN